MTPKKGHVEINSGKLKAAIEASNFTQADINRYLKRNATYITDVLSRGTFDKDDLGSVCELLKCRMEDLLVIRDEPEPPEAKPVTARNDASQNWMINIYRAVETQTDRIDAAAKEIRENTDAVRGLYTALMGQTAVLREMKTLLGETKLAAESINTSTKYSQQEVKKQLERIFNQIKFGRES